MKLCPKCQKQFSDDANFCPVDAARLLLLDGQTSAPNDSLATRFELGGRLGGNRTGVVLRAVDRQTHQAVAIKVISPAVLQIPGVAQRLERELKQLERVTTPGVAKLVASGKHTTPTGEETWIAMELVEGAQTLGQVIAARGPIGAEHAGDVIEVIGEALIEAAQVGVVHRDLAPKNVLLAGQDIKLINFSLPVPTEPSTAFAAKVAGVPEFVAPEQVDGKPVDQRSNLYNLGALYYFVLTGRPVASGTVEEIHHIHASGQIVPPSQLVPTIPPAVEALILRALDKSPTKRFLTVRQFVDEVGRVAGGDHKATIPIARPNRPRAEIVQTLLGVNLMVPVAQASSGIASAPTVGGVPVLAPVVASTPASAPAAAAVVNGPGVTPAGTMVGLASGSHNLPDPAPASVWSPPAGAAAAPAAIAPPVVAAPVIASPMAAAPSQPVVGRPLVGPPNAITPPPQPIVAAPVVAAPVVAAPVVAGAAAGKKRPAEDPSSKGKFRETLWFKKGELDAAAAQVAAAEAAKGKDVADKADTLPIDERYKDDGTISRSDKEKYSLRTGATQMMQAVKDPGRSPANSAKVSEDALIGEMKSGRSTILIAIVLGLLVVVGLVLLFSR